MTSIRHTSFRSRTTRVALLLLFALSLSLVLGAAARGDGATATATSVTPTAQGKVLVQRFFTLLRNADTAGLRKLLAPGFQVVRANGGVQDKASYLANPPKVDRFKILKLKGTQTGDVLVVSYQIAVTETIGGAEQPATRSPRLSVFQRANGAWYLVAHANFGAIT